MLLGFFDNLEDELIKPLLLSSIFTLIGVVIFAACIWIVIKVTPFSVRKEIEDDQNISLGIIIGSMIIGIAIILAASIHG